MYVDACMYACVYCMYEKEKYNIHIYKLILFFITGKTGVIFGCADINAVCMFKQIHGKAYSIENRRQPG